MRVAVLAFVLLLSVAARAEEDDDLLDARPMGDPVPERLQALEREWAADVGTKEAPEGPANAAEELREPSPFEDEAEVETRPNPDAAKPAQPKPRSALPPPLKPDAVPDAGRQAATTGAPSRGDEPDRARPDATSQKD